MVAQWVCESCHLWADCPRLGFSMEVSTSMALVPLTVLYHKEKTRVSANAVLCVSFEFNCNNIIVLFYRCLFCQMLLSILEI